MNRKRLTPMEKYGPFAAVAVALAVVLVVAPTKSRDSTGGYASAFTSRGAGGATPTTTLKGVYGNDCARREFFGRTYTCMPLWRGDNGGATYKGVTRDQITVAFYLPKSNDGVSAVLAGGGLASKHQDQVREIKAYTRFFARMYQFWGRKLNVKIVDGTADTGDAAAFRADAVRIDQEIRAALVIGAPDLDMIDELARRGIPCVCGNQLPAKFHQDHAPYVFGILPDGGTTNSHIAEFVCERLGPHSKADFSGAVIHPSIGRRGEVERRYALAYPSGYWGAENARDLKGKLARCGISFVSEVSYSSDINTAAQQATANTQTAIQNKATTIICVCDPFAPVYGTKAATQQRYFPEWVVTGYDSQDADAVARLYDQDQWQHAFGVSSLPAQVRNEDTLWYKAYKQEDPGSEPNAATAPLIFPSLQIALIGVERAGPDYNPDTYAKGMFAINTKSQDKYSPTFAYSRNDYGGIDDFREIWWSRNDKDLDGNTGTYLSVNDSYRHLTGQWPASPTKVFRRECLPRGSCGEQRS